MTYDVVFDIAHADRTWWTTVDPLLCVFIAGGIIGLVQLRRKRTQGIDTSFTITKVVSIWITVLIVSAVYVSHFMTRMEYRRLLAAHRAAVVEGPVEQFVPQPPFGKGYEQFTVQGVHFAYSDTNLTTGGYNQISKDGEPIAAGRFVRVHYIPGVVSDNLAEENIILKLEVRRIE